MVVSKGKPNFTEGPIFSRLLLFTFPIIATALLTTFYHMADNIVVGQFSGDENALAAVGQTGAYSSLLSNILFGISAGGGVVVAQLFGANRREEMKRSIHTSIVLAFLMGVVMLLIGLFASRGILSMIIAEKNQAALLDKSTLYMQIISLGMPALSVYSFGSAVRRALGDSKTPLIIGGVSGLVNVALNLVFVICFKMSVAGVALATIISQYLSAISVMIVLSRSSVEGGRFEMKSLGIDKVLLGRILRYGIPSSIQFAIFSVANMILASAVSTLPLITVNAVSIAGNVDAITYQCMNGFTTSVMTFVGQNYGALKKDRMRRSLIYGVIQVTVIGIAAAALELLFAKELCGLFVGADIAHRAEVIAKSVDVMFTILPLYFLCGVMGVLSGYLRGVGNSVMPMISSVSSVLLVRFTWIFVFFPMRPDSVEWLYLCYPITWALTIVINLVMIFFERRRIDKLFASEKEETAEDAAV